MWKKDNVDVSEPVKPAPEKIEKKPQSAEVSAVAKDVKVKPIHAVEEWSAAPL